jgi:hypothetical protein
VTIRDNEPDTRRRHGFYAGAWWRFSSYTLKNGNIRPTPKAKLECFDPWQVKLSFAPPDEPLYQSLLFLGRSLRFTISDELDAKSTDRVLSWCSECGLLGILPHYTTHVSLAPRWRRLGDVLMPAKTVYYRQGGSWAAAIEPIGMADRPYRSRNEGGLFVHDRNGGDWLEAKAMMWDSTSDVQGLIVEPLDHAWGDFFPDVPAKAKGTFSYPMPTGQEFWHMYSEPMDRFLAGITTLSDALEAAKWMERAEPTPYGISRSRLLNEIVSPVSPMVACSDGSYRIRWSSPSQLASLAMMAILDLAEAGATVFACPVCSTHFVSRAYQVVYCSDRCRRTAQKRAQRERLKLRNARKGTSHEKARTK